MSTEPDSEPANGLVRSRCVDQGENLSDQEIRGLYR